MQKFNLVLMPIIALSFNLSLSGVLKSQPTKASYRDALVFPSQAQTIYPNMLTEEGREDLELAAQIAQFRIVGKQRTEHRLNAQDQRLLVFIQAIQAPEEEYVE